VAGLQVQGGEPLLESKVAQIAAQQGLSTQQWMLREQMVDGFPFACEMQGMYQGFSMISATFQAAGDPPPEALVQYRGTCTVRIQCSSYTGDFLIDFQQRQCRITWHQDIGLSRHGRILAAFCGRLDYSSTTPKMCFISNTDHMCPPYGAPTTVELDNPAWMAGAEKRAQEGGYQGRIFMPYYRPAGFEYNDIARSGESAEAQVH